VCRLKRQTPPEEPENMNPKQPEQQQPPELEPKEPENTIPCHIYDDISEYNQLSDLNKETREYQRLGRNLKPINDSHHVYLEIIGDQMTQTSA